MALGAAQGLVGKWSDICISGSKEPNRKSKNSYLREQLHYFEIMHAQWILMHVLEELPEIALAFTFKTRIINKSFFLSH